MRLALQAQKRVVGTPSWAAGNRLHKFVLAVLAESPEINAELHVTALATVPDEDVSFQLCLAEPANTYPIVRFDWRPLRPHVNRFGPMKGAVSETGLHPFEENAQLGLSFMVAHNLPVCLPVEPEPRDFYEAAAYMCATFNIEFEDELPAPPWLARLL